MKIQIIKMPLDYGAGTRGTDKGPESIVNDRLLERLRKLGHEVEVAECPAARHDEKMVEREDAKYLSSIAETNERLAAMVDKAASDGWFPLIIGGDHSLLLGSLAGISTAAKKEGKNVGVIYIDAHGDFNTTETSPTGNIHGMPLAASCGYGLQELTELYTKERKIDPKDVCIIGARDLDEGEKVLLKEAGVKVYTTSDILAMSIGKIVKECLARLESCDYIHVSFDVDSVDPLYAPGTGIHLPGGLSYGEAIYLMELLGACGKTVSTDIVEFNPSRDMLGKTKEMCESLIAHLVGERYFG